MQAQPSLLADLSKPLSVSTFLDQINDRISDFTVGIEGEITSVSDRGHVYFSIADSDQNQKAVLSCALWKFRAQRLSFKLEEGMSVQLIGSANVYKPSGRFSFIVEHVSPVGEGALKKAFEQLKKMLDEKGFFDIERKRKLPAYPKKIGLLTSAQGDAIKDFKTHLGTFGFEIFHMDCRVEGINAIPSLVKGVRQLNIQFPDLDVLVMTRGGGSLESLQAFNSLEVAQALAASKIPVLSAVGHENDVTIADLVADQRASTPTDAGRQLSENWRKAEQELAFFQTTLDTHFTYALAETRASLASVWKFQTEHVQQLLSEYGYSIVLATTQLFAQLRFKAHEFQKLESHFEQNFSRVQHRVLSEKNELKQSLSKMVWRVHMQYRSVQAALDNHEARLHLSDPSLKLKQGYSMMWDAEGKLIARIAGVKPGDTVSLQVSDGNITAEVVQTSATKAQ